ncbi:hypothetical protein Wcon_01662 [Wolbachia endosymbiont of Cylisticus convexus]|nr:hypothetical protein Wcon_01662 [Wolbachia endosymbiont of Cylisticus convexus]
MNLLYIIYYPKSDATKPLGSRYKNICKLFNEQQILGAYNVHDER